MEIGNESRKFHMVLKLELKSEPEPKMVPSIYTEDLLNFFNRHLSSLALGNLKPREFEEEIKETASLSITDHKGWSQLLGKKHCKP
ncbi:hypothetical protein EV182_004333 [Spiromyces aspiralis]|uniref:Uncharacterized protein n=1 Tax=Spiromyces aspiralis TaxID=68401 RepID=A0ACC1HDW4_9FUNG|nr:hypothetical protein EV182_004333 [Spiromyces aspiralis]